MIEVEDLNVYNDIGELIEIRYHSGTKLLGIMDVKTGMLDYFKKWKEKCDPIDAKNRLITEYRYEEHIKIILCRHNFKFDRRFIRVSARYCRINIDGYRYVEVAILEDKIYCANEHNQAIDELPVDQAREIWNNYIIESQLREDNIKLLLEKI